MPDNLSDLLLNTVMLMDSMSTLISRTDTLRQPRLSNSFYDRVGGQLVYLDTMVAVAQSLEDWVAARPERNDWEDTAGWDTGIETIAAKVWRVSKETPDQFEVEVREQISGWIEEAFEKESQ